jgi:hypothetical protein
MDTEGVLEPALGLDVEHPASSNAPTAAAAAIRFRDIAAVMPSNSARGYTDGSIL